MLLFLVLISAFIFLRFYQLDERLPFTWDQIQNSWVMKNMLIDHRFPLEGMVAKGNAGFYIGPAYYYLLAPFYVIFRLDPIASGVFAGLVAVINFVVLYFVTRKIFSAPVALFAGFIYTFSYISINSDRVAWPVIFIPLVSILIFYFLYRSLTDKPIYILWVALVTGFAFHVHFTSIFYPFIIILTLPVLLRNKKIWFYSLLAIPFFAVWFVPTFVAGVRNGFSSAGNLSRYISVYNHGFHLVRFRQLMGDAFIQFSAVLYIEWLKKLSLIFLPLFIIIFNKVKPLKNAKILSVLFILWFLVPWVIFSLYSGEITDYYFILTRPLVFMVLGYLIYIVFKSKIFLLKLSIIMLLVIYAVINVKAFDDIKYFPMPKVREAVRQDIEQGKAIPFHDGDPEAYLFYIKTLKTK